ncbi:MAG: nitroreductase [Burkholderiales bacterium]
MDFEQGIKARYSCRKFQSREIPREIIEKIVKISQHTASWNNVQPWRVLIASGEAACKFSAALVNHVEAGGKPNPDFAFPTDYRGVERERRKTCGLQLYQAAKITREDEAGKRNQMLENFRLFGAPHVALITAPAYLGFYAALDCGLYVNSFMLAAKSLGIDTIAQAAIAHYSDFVREYFSIGEDRKLVCAISFGYEERDHPINQYRTERAALDEVVTWR